LDEQALSVSPVASKPLRGKQRKATMGESGILHGAEAQLIARGIELPTPSVPPALYSPLNINGRLVSISGQPPFWNGTITHYGKVGRDLSLDEGRAAARVSALNILAHLRSACDGHLDRVTGCVRMLVLVNCVETFNEVHRVADAASGLMQEVCVPKTQTRTYS
jgi:enamine deaminase RidA (YjgF/YER057c/UK114 family)